MRLNLWSNTPSTSRPINTTPDSSEAEEEPDNTFLYHPADRTEKQYHKVRTNRQFAHALQAIVRQKIKQVAISTNPEPLDKEKFMQPIMHSMPQVQPILTPQWNQFISNAIRKEFPKAEVGKEGHGERRRIYTNLTLI